VFLDASDISTTRPSKKLSHQFLGPYPVLEKVSTHAYRLKLPRSMSQLHPVFHVVKLRRSPVDPIPGRKVVAPPPPVLKGGEEHYEVEEVRNSRTWRGKLQFLVRWKGYGAEDDSWEAERDVDAPRLIEEFYRRNPGAPRRIEQVSFANIPFTPRDESP